MDKELFNDAIYQIFESWSSLQVSSINNFIINIATTIINFLSL